MRQSGLRDPSPQYPASSSPLQKSGYYAPKSMQLHGATPHGTAPSITGAAKRYENHEPGKKGSTNVVRGNIVGSQYQQSVLPTPSQALAGDSYQNQPRKMRRLQDGLVQKPGPIHAQELYQQRKSNDITSFPPMPPRNDEKNSGFQSYAAAHRQGPVHNGQLDQLTARNINSQYSHAKVPKRIDRPLVDFMKPGHTVNQSMNLMSHRLNDSGKIAFASSRRQMPTTTSNDRIEQVRKSYDYGGNHSSSPRMTNHIYSSAVEILKNNPKHGPYAGAQASHLGTQPSTSSTQVVRPTALLLENAHQRKLAEGSRSGRANHGNTEGNPLTSKEPLSGSHGRGHPAQKHTDGLLTSKKASTEFSITDAPVNPRGGVGKSQQFKKAPPFQAVPTPQPVSNSPLNNTVDLLHEIGRTQSTQQRKGVAKSTSRQSGVVYPQQTKALSPKGGTVPRKQQAYSQGVHQLPMRPIIQRAKVAQKAQAPNFSSYGANTHNGLVRGYNEDRISIVLDLKKPGVLSKAKAAEQDPAKKIQYFAIFDGHGGHSCAEFLRDNLHNIIATQACFPKDIESALVQGCREAEDTWMRQNVDYVRDRSGSCAVVLLVTKDACYIANVGDSRAVLSKKGGTIVESITTDHKPCEPSERARVEKGGGRVYQSSSQIAGMGGATILGPMRVLPGKLSVSRTFGDCTAKMEKYGGNPRCVVAEAEIHKVIPDSDLDFIMMGSDGIFDKLSSKQVSDAFWEEAKRTSQESGAPDCPFDVEADCCGQGVDRILNYVMETESMDNISAVVLSYSNFRNTLSGKTERRASMSKPQSNHSAQRITETSKEYVSGDSESRSGIESRQDTADSLDQSAQKQANQSRQQGRRESPADKPQIQTSRTTNNTILAPPENLPPVPPLSRERQQLQNINSDSKFLVPVSYNYGGQSTQTKESIHKRQNSNAPQRESNDKMQNESKSVLPSLKGSAQPPELAGNPAGMLIGRGRRIDKLSNITNDNNMMAGAGSQRSYIRKKFL